MVLYTLHVVHTIWDSTTVKKKQKKTKIWKGIRELSVYIQKYIRDFMY